MKQNVSLKEGRASGFTLIELMIVVAIIGILAAIAIPKFANLLRQSSEGATKGNLGALRSALSIYYGDNTGVYPADNLASMTIGGKYLSVIPNANEPPYHSGSSSVNAVQNGLGGLTDGVGWLYDNNTSDANYGTVWVQCTHTDTKGTTWTSY